MPVLCMKASQIIFLYLRQTCDLLAVRNLSQLGSISNTEQSNRILLCTVNAMLVRNISMFCFCEFLHTNKLYCGISY
jgi:hypothetical protein